MIQLFGIRHHGPGSARRLLHALQAWQPDVILVEAPLEAEELFPWIGHSLLVPPVAMLLYNPQQLSQACYLPFARFSPEWQAIHFANQQGTPVWAMDLPMRHLFALPPESGQLPLDADPSARQMQQDPLLFLAELAGYSDSETWWDHLFEGIQEDAAVFTGIIEMITALREQGLRAESRESILREAYMRQRIREAIKAGFQRIAVVCGAWHTPALQRAAAEPAKADQALLRKLPKQPVKATWIPWSYERLAFQSGYRAGVISPAWYALLFERPQELSTRWLVRAARSLRRENLAASAAEVQEAVRLADTLAVIRNRSIPSLAELEDAAIAVFCRGETALFIPIHQQLVIGDAIGETPPDIPQAPLQRDFEQAVKSARLSKELRSSETLTKKLDLRVPANLRASQLLHRLRLLDIHWGKLGRVSAEAQGSFQEAWKLKWRPEMIIELIERGMWGSTIEEAAQHYALSQAENADLAELITLLEDALLADLSLAVAALTRQLQGQAAQTHDIFRLLQALPPLVQLNRYGSIRPTDTALTTGLLREILVRIFTGLPQAALQLDEEPARELFSLISIAQRAIQLLNEPSHTAGWLHTLQQLEQLPEAHPLLRGVACRLLLDKNAYPPTLVEQRMAFALSPGQTPTEASSWLEGFLAGSGLLLIHQPALWSMLDQWVSQLPYETFQEVLPLLRRTFTQFSSPEREQLLLRAKSDTPPTLSYYSQDPGQQRAAAVRPLIAQILGLVLSSGAANDRQSSQN